MLHLLHVYWVESLLNNKILIQLNQHNFKHDFLIDFNIFDLVKKHNILIL